MLRSRVVICLIVLGSMFLHRPAEAEDRVRMSTLRRQTVVSSGRNQSDVGLVLNFFGKVPYLFRKSTVDVSVSFDESSIDEDHGCAIANTVPKSFPYAPFSFTTNASVNITNFSNSDTLHSRITGGHRCPVEVIDGCSIDDVTIDFVVDGGTGEYITVNGNGTLRLQIKKCGYVSEILSNHFIFWSFSRQ